MSVLRRAAEAKEHAQAERSFGHYEQAEEILREAAADLESVIETAQSEERKAIAAEVADVLGILGGLYKQQNDFAAAATAYDAGFQYESAPQFGISSSYNALNRLIVRVLMPAKSPAAAPEPNAVDVPLQLRQLRRVLEASVNGERKFDYWAAGDLAVTCALLGDDSGAQAAASHFASLSPPQYAYAAYSETLASLADAVPDLKLTLGNLRHRFRFTSTLPG